MNNLLDLRLKFEHERKSGSGGVRNLNKTRSTKAELLASLIDDLKRVRAFYGKGHLFRCKPAAGIVCCRRAGATAAFDELNKYFTISSMPVVSSKYWNMVHGTTPEEALKDEEGMQVMRELGRNMAWLLKCIRAGKEAGISEPERETPIKTNFIR